MANLPEDRLIPAPPFLHTGVDVMGPRSCARGYKTRGTVGTHKLWAVLFTCLASRAVHIEVINSLDTCAMKNSLSKFFALRGPCKILRSDRGTNFISASKKLNLDHIVDSLDKDCQWMFNTPLASHHGGVWERKIKEVEKYVDASLLLTGNKKFNLWWASYTSPRSRCNYKF